MTPDNSEIKFDIHSWYGVISPDNETKVIAPGKTSVQISTAPYILPVFWIIAFAEINPYLPAVAEIIIYTSIFTLILLPIWYKKTIRGNHKKKIRFHRLLAQWKRDLHIG
jgi:signal peptidase